ncbi:DUF6261 family protein [Riemerella columbipharyngis]|uniref:Uncharacterized protein n=1 Tax=Riemerella columbipharyngis TaxID=1071918 RepID=A0A1G7DRR2_9FLAO|nr:DUF6261 family protein [Riemerella columbipharyngis]SDE54163.1 hypothetical protein SAMN05421544_11229 [Riemerella columbipharyngis]
MIKELSLSKVRLMEFYQVMKSVKTFLEQENLETLQLQNIKTEFDDKLTALDEALKPLTKSTFTEALQKEDETRDTLLVGLQMHCRAFVNFPNEAKSKAAKSLLLAVEKYGKNIQSKALQEETGIITNLLEDFAQSPYKEELKTIGATEWITALTASNQKFTELYNSRNQERGAIEVGKSKKTRKEMNQVFSRLVKTINALALINGETGYTNLANNLNETIRKAKL